MDLQTKNCLFCKNEATHYTGHVHDKKGKKITAGYCDNHEYLAHCLGCMGVYKKQMGKQKFVA